MKRTSKWGLRALGVFVAAAFAGGVLAAAPASAAPAPQAAPVTSVIETGDKGGDDKCGTRCGGDHKKYVEDKGKLICACPPVKGKNAVYEIVVKFGVYGKGHINPFDKTVIAGAGFGKHAKYGVLYKVAPGVFAGKLSFAPTYYKGLEVTKHAKVWAKVLKCKVYVDSHGKLPCCVTKVKKHQQLVFVVKFHAYKGAINPGDKFVQVTDGKHHATLTKQPNGTFAGKLSFAPTAYYGLSTTPGAKVHVKVLVCKLIKKTPPPCGCKGDKPITRGDVALAG